MNLTISVALAIGLFSHSCGRTVAFKIATESPDSHYRVEFEGKKEPPNALPGEFYNQIVALRAFKDKELVGINQSFYKEDHYDPLFLEAFPKREWVNNSTLRLGDAMVEPFHDEISVVNNTTQRIDLLVLEVGKFETFLLFDLKPTHNVILQASPQIDKGGPPPTIFYTCYQSGRFLLNNTQELPARKARQEPIRTVVEVKLPEN